MLVTHGAGGKNTNLIAAEYGKDDPLCKSVGLRGRRLRLFLDDLVERFPKGIVGRSPRVDVLASRHRSAWALTTTIRKAFVLAAPQISRP